jgi:glycosyltransferase involved in cell wall biosynthesis
VNPARIVFDLSTSMRWTGPPVGIVRVERELARWAHAHLPNVHFVFFDPERQEFREVSGDVTRFLNGDAALDTLGMTHAALPGKRRTDLIPSALKPAFIGMTQLRRTALRFLERVRLKTGSAWLSDLADRWQRRIMSKKYRGVLVKPDGSRRQFLPSDMVLGERMQLDPGDTLICAGSGWGNTNIDTIRDLKSAANFRMVLMCYDLIPLLFPQFYREFDVRLFRNYMHQALAMADLTIFSAHKVEADARAYCAQHGIALGKTAVVPFGFDGAAGVNAGAALPAGLQPGRFAMLVSTIEPRKGHALMLHIWQRLLAEGIPQQHDFKLVFVGRPGWMMEQFMAELARDAQAAQSIVNIRDADDDTLTALYEAVAFCVYPSRYEGYGLPVVEAFARGKAVIASTGGALPEIVQNFSPCLDSQDEEMWYRTLRQWILDKEARAPFERAIKSQFHHPSWSDAAAIFFETTGIKPQDFSLRSGANQEAEARSMASAHQKPGYQ